MEVKYGLMRQVIIYFLHPQLLMEKSLLDHLIRKYTASEGINHQKFQKNQTDLQKEL